MNAAQTKQRVSIVVSILCGALATGLVWRSLHREDPRADLTAKAAGFTSAAEADQSMQFFGKATKTGHLDPDDFVQIQDILSHGNRGQKRAVLTALEHVKGVDQFRQALSLIDKVGMPNDVTSQWRLTFVWWVKYQRDPNALPLLMASKSPQVVELAKGIKNEG